MSMLLIIYILSKLSNFDPWQPQINLCVWYSVKLQCLIGASLGNNLQFVEQIVFMLLNQRLSFKNLSILFNQIRVCFQNEWKIFLLCFKRNQFFNKRRQDIALKF